ncbi:SDR family NAD(P)-dependent oxidoreductase [Haloferacaceae archaeon DSL9]
MVTGASRGLDASMAKTFALGGSNVVASARSRGALESVADEIETVGVGDALVVPADVTDADAIQTLVDTAVDACAGRLAAHAVGNRHS